MTIATYTQGRKLQNHIARIGQFDDVKSPDYGKFYLDVVKEYGTSRNNHGIEPTKNISIIEKWLKNNGFICIARAIIAANGFPIDDNCSLIEFSR